MRVFALAITILLAVPQLASADDFDASVNEARPIPSADGVAALFWSQEAGCKGSGNDMLRRQCEGLRSMRRSMVAKETFVVDVGGDAIDVGEVDAKDVSVEVRLRACVACEADGPVVVGKGAHSAKGNRIVAAELAKGSKRFKSVKEANRWQKYISPRLRAQLIFRVPAKLSSFRIGGRQGSEVEVLSYRLYDPCQGEVLASKPGSKKGPVRVSTCKTEAPEVATQPEEPKGPVEPARPDRLTTSQINDAMASTRKAADACYDAYGIEGMASFRLIIGASGQLSTSDQSGDFVGTPTGVCLDQAVKSAKFPKSKKKETPITYPIILQ